VLVTHATCPTVKQLVQILVS